MNISETLNYWEHKKQAYYHWFYNLTWIQRILLACVMAGVTGIAAQIRLHLPFTPVPITGQVLAVLLAGVLLGHLFGGLSMLLYLIIGFCGIPWFSGGVPGFPIGPTTGYIIGFIPAALIVGWITEHIGYKNRMVRLICMMMLSTSIIYTCGALHFAFFMKTGLKQTLDLAVLPFIPFDLCKAVIAAGIAKILLPPSAP